MKFPLIEVKEVAAQLVILCNEEPFGLYAEIVGSEVSNIKK